MCIILLHSHCESQTLNKELDRRFDSVIMMVMIGMKDEMQWIDLKAVKEKSLDVEEAM